MHKGFLKRYIHSSDLKEKCFNKVKKSQRLNKKKGSIHRFLLGALFFAFIEAAADVSSPAEKKLSYPWRGKEEAGIRLNLKTFYIFKTKQFAFYPEAAVFYEHPAINIDVGYQYSVLEKEPYYRISSLEMSFPLPVQKLLLSIGFKNHLWSQADQYWNYGFWQPRYLIDPLRPKQMGLSGLYLSYKGDSSLLLYASPFILPDIGARIRLAGGKPFSKSPFFITPFQLQKETSKFSWEIEDIKSFRLLDILKPAVALQMSHKMRFSGLSLSYAYKPVNRPYYSVFIPKTALSALPGVPDVFSLDEEKLEKSLPEKSPIYKIKNLDYTFLRHHLATIEAEMLPSPYLSLIGSLTYEKPENFEPPNSFWVSQSRESNLTAAFLFQVKDNINEKESALFTLAYSDVFEIDNRAPSANVWLKGYQYYFSGRKDWKNSLAASLEYKTQTILTGYEFNIRLNYSLDNELYLLSFENSALLSSSLRVYISGDLFLKFTGKTSSFSSSYIAHYRNMSRIIAGAEYVF